MAVEEFEVGDAFAEVDGDGEAGEVLEGGEDGAAVAIDFASGEEEGIGGEGPGGVGFDGAGEG